MLTKHLCCFFSYEMAFSLSTKTLFSNLLDLSEKKFFTVFQIFFFAATLLILRLKKYDLYTCVLETSGLICKE